MSVVQEFEGKTIESAVQRACDALNIEKDALAYEILSHGSSGIFGIVGVRKAKILVKRIVEDPQKNHAPAPATASERIVAENTTNGAQSRVNASGCAHDADDAKEGTQDAACLELGQKALQKMVDAISSGTTITCRQDADQMMFTIDGGNAAILIGKHGQTLEAMQYLIEKIINRRSERRIYLQIDVGGYLENRRQNLRSLARRMAAKAKKNGKPVTIGQLRPQERRIVHLELKEDQHLRTQSVGDGFIRKLIIIPRKKSRIDLPRKPGT